MAPWIADVLGKPWVPGARGPDAFDCWGLVWHVYAKHLGITLPLFGGHSVECQTAALAMTHGLATTPDWKKIEHPEELCLVAMGRRSVIHHVGLWTCADGGLVVHAADGERVTGQSLSTLRTIRFASILFFKHDNCRAPLKPI